MYLSMSMDEGRNGGKCWKFIIQEKVKKKKIDVEKRIEILIPLICECIIVTGIHDELVVQLFVWWLVEIEEKIIFQGCVFLCRRVLFQ